MGLWMSKFNQSRMIEECAEYQEYIEREDSLNALLEEMYDYYREFANLELQGLNNGWEFAIIGSVLWFSLGHLFWWVSWS